jgi:uncharacterized protein (TIGR03435 family)
MLPKLQKSLILLALSGANAQTAMEGRAPSFEVASIKPSDPNAHGSSSNSDRRLWTITNWTLRRLVQRAFNVEDYQVAGGPNWIDSYHVDIRAAMTDADTAGTPKERMERMRVLLQALLVERFQLQFHSETKTLPIYNLVAAKSGFKLTAMDGKGNESMSSGHGRLESKGVSMQALSVFLSREMRRPVVDASGIPGVFNFNLEWTAQEEPLAKPADGNDATGPSIFTALQEQLGLKLESGKGPVEIIVVDHAEKPTEN